MAEQPRATLEDALYFGPAMTGPEGVNCGTCMMFLRDTSQCSILRPPKVSGKTGGCRFYIKGDPTTSEKHPPMKIMPADVAGYSEEGPFRCGNCEYFSGVGYCKKFRAGVQEYGCCNGWEAK